ncbi:MAG: hypothetical protein KGN34_05025 [Sphingomonadales bacterium]|nr:hypothetical protein [Sphingomonadales bacterium]
MQEDDRRTLLMLLRFKRLMGRLLLLMLGLVVLGIVGLKRHSAPMVVHGVFAAAALCAFAMLLAPLVMAWLARKR